MVGAESHGTDPRDRDGPVMGDLRDELHENVDAAVDAKEQDDAAEARLAAMEQRISAAETREIPQPDLSRFVTHEDLDSKFDALLGAITGLATPKPVEATTETHTDDDDEEETEEAPKIVTQMTSKAEIEEHAPRPSHFLFKRLGR